MSFRDYKKNIDKKREEQNVFNSLNSAISKLEKKRDEYAEKAKQMLKSGNKAQYSAYVALLKNSMFNLAQAQDMLANYTIACDLREMQTLNRSFVRSIDNVMKEVYKTSASINVASSQKLFLKALDKQNYTASELRNLLEANNIAFSSSVTTLSDISDDDVRSLLENEIRKDEADFDDTLAKLEEEFSVKAPEKTAPAAFAEGGSGAQAPAAPTRPTEKPAEKPIDKPADRPVEKPIDKPIDKPFEKPEEKPEERPIEKPAERPAEKPAEKPAGKPADKPDASDKGFEVVGNAFRPQKLDDYVGQPEVVATIKPPIKKARLTGKALPHVLLAGSYGQGKTTLARIIANELGTKFTEITPLMPARDFVRVLRGVGEGDVIFIDEVHKVSTDVVEAVLYPAMENYELHFTENVAGKTVTKTQKLPPFTLIGATTETGKLLKPFYSKFPINLTLREYKPEVIAGIVKNSFRVNGMSISEELALNVARRSQLVPRIANAFVEGIVSLALVNEAERRGISSKGAFPDVASVRALNITITREEVEEYFKIRGIDELGLGEEHRKILEVIIHRFNGGPVGQESLAKALNVATNRVDGEYEPFLVKLGFINVRPQGRYATEEAYKYLGLSPTNAKLEKEQKPEGGAQAPANTAPEKAPENAAPAPENTASATAAPEAENEDMHEITCVPGEFDGEYAANIEKLFSGEGTARIASIDEQFDAVGKEYDSAAANRCVLKVQGVRDIYCDSKLERRFIKKLFEKGFVKDVKAEALELDYASDSMGGKKYYPDFVMLLHDGRTAIVEMKNFAAMGNHLNMAKYRKLAEWCTENGFMYAEIAQDPATGRYVSAEEIKSRPVNAALKEFVYGKIEENGFCSGADLAETTYEEADLQNLLMNDRGLKNTDRTGKNPNITES